MGDSLQRNPLISEQGNALVNEYALAIVACDPERIQRARTLLFTYLGDLELRAAVIELATALAPPNVVLAPTTAAKHFAAAAAYYALAATPIGGPHNASGHVSDDQGMTGPR